MHDAQKENMLALIVEILVYQLKPATGPAFFEIMQRVSVPMHRQLGIDVVWHGQSLHDPDGYGLIRAFADLPALEVALGAFYESPDWRSGPREEIIASIETATRIVIPMNAEAIEGIRRQGYFCRA